MLRCHDVPAYSEGGVECSAMAGAASVNGCVNWNQYYNICRQGDYNPHKGAVNFDNIGYAWIAIFQVSYWHIIFAVTHRFKFKKLYIFIFQAVTALSYLISSLCEREIQPIMDFIRVLMCLKNPD